MPPGEPLSPELVLVAPPDEARLARAWLEAEDPRDEERTEQIRRAWKLLAEHRSEHSEEAWEAVAVRAAEQVERAREQIALRAAELAQRERDAAGDEPMAVEPVVDEVPKPVVEPEPEPEPEPFVSNVDEEAPDWETLLARLRTEPVESPVTFEAVVEAPPTARRGWRRGIVGVCALLTVVLLVGVAWARGWVGGGNSSSPTTAPRTSAAPRHTSTPAPAGPRSKRTQTTASANPTPKKPKPTHAPTRPKTKKAPAAFVPARVWSWPRVAGASRYRVRFFQNGRRVLDVRTTKPRLVLPPTFTFQPGRYRWSVLPISAAGKALPAVVNSTFVVGR